MHHDEILHAVISKDVFEKPNDKFYKYDPLLHGPLLYNTVPLVYQFLGMSNASVRFLPALLGSLFLLLPLLFRRYLSPGGVLALTTAVALSPSLVYWSRFIRHDPFVFAWWFVMLYGATLAREKTRALFILPAIALQFCTKENAFVTIALLVGYLLFEFCFIWAFRRNMDTLLGSALKHCWNNLSALCLAVIVCYAIYFYYYSGAFAAFPDDWSNATSKQWSNTFDALAKSPFTTGLSYWINQNNIERLKGPFLYQFYMLTLYEFPFIIAFFVQIFLFYLQAGRWIKLIGATVFAAAMAIMLHYLGDSVEKAPLWAFLKLKDALDIFGLILLAAHALIVTVHHLIRRERALAFFGYFFIATFWSYCYLGEKAPWLSSYPLMTGLIYLTLFFTRYFNEYPLNSFSAYSTGRLIGYLGVVLLSVALIFKLEDGSQTSVWLFTCAALLIFSAAAGTIIKLWSTLHLGRFILVVFAIYSLRAALLTNYGRAGDETELIGHVHTTKQFQQVALRLRAEMLNSPETARPKVLAMDSATWPLFWYLRGFQFNWSKPSNDDYSSFDYIIREQSKCNTKNIPPGFSCATFTLRGWWVPEYSKMTFKKIIRYVLFHEPWNGTGTVKMTLYQNDKKCS